jgi:hypothetical protein
MKFHNIGSDKFDKWVENNTKIPLNMDQMESILATNASARKAGESDLEYITNYIEQGLFTQLGFKGGSRKKRFHRKLSHRNRTAHRKRKRSQRKRA